MPADDVLPWKLLLSKLRRSDDSRVSYDEVLRTGWQPEPLVVRERVLAMQALWSDDEASFSGAHVSFPPSWAWPKPVQVVGGDNHVDRGVHQATSSTACTSAIADTCATSCRQISPNCDSVNRGRPRSTADGATCSVPVRS